jgi:hypothetical protein
MGDQSAVEGKALDKVPLEVIAVLEDNESARPGSDQLERGIHNDPYLHGLGLSRASEEKPNGVGLNQDLADLVPKDDDNYEDGNRTCTLEEPARQDQAGSLGDALKEPEKKQAHHNLEGGCAPKKEEEAVDDKTDDENIRHILPLEGEKELRWHSR